MIPERTLQLFFWKYLIDIRSEAWLNILWEHKNEKLFAV
jgi:hypothetical protein